LFLLCAQRISPLAYYSSKPLIISAQNKTDISPMHSFSNLETNFAQAPNIKGLDKFCSQNHQLMRSILMHSNKGSSNLVQYLNPPELASTILNHENNLCCLATSFQAKQTNNPRF